VGALRHQSSSALQRPAAVWGPDTASAWGDAAFHVWRLFFLCEITGGEPEAGPETSEVARFGEHELPSELSTRWALLAQIRRMSEHLRQPDLPTDFN
jgi:hypothetical protein